MAILLGLSPLLVSELVFRVVDRGHVSDAEDPYVGFAGVHPLFTKNHETNRYEIPKSRQTYFCPESFAIRKPDNEFRIFCLGGSTVQGRPYAIETSFTSWLELSLKACDPNRQWEVVNCGGVSYASYRLTPILEEVLAYEPDLFILYTGHNEFLEDRTYDRVKRLPRSLALTHGWLSRLRTYNALRSVWIHFRSPKRVNPAENRPQLPVEVDAMLDYKGGLAEYDRDDHWRDTTVKHFDFNLRRMIRLAERADVPVILVNPVSNLKDTPPFKFAVSNELSDKQQQEFDELWEKAKSPGISDTERIALLRQAIALDGRHAGVRFHLGKCYVANGQLAQGRKQLIRAKDEDLCPLRILDPMRKIVVDVAGDTSASLIDAHRLFEQLTVDGLPGNEWLADHVHPSIRGHQQLASQLLNEMIRREFVQPADGWEQRREQLHRDHFESLGVFYFIRGQQRLQGLQRWSKGQVTRLRSDESQ